MNIDSFLKMYAAELQELASAERQDDAPSGGVAGGIGRRAVRHGRLISVPRLAG